MTHLPALGLAALLLAVSASPAAAHAFGQRFDLPVPLSFFLFGAGAAVALSFVVAALFMRHRPDDQPPKVNLLNAQPFRILAHPVPVFVIRLIFVGVFFLIIATGYAGNQNPLQNFSVVMVWVIAWVGLAFVCSLLGNAWALLNPWNTLFLWAERIHGAATGRRLSRSLACPPGTGSWPAVILFAIFAWMEISWPGGAVPRNIAVALTIYSVVTWTGMFLTGREEWLERGEAFHNVFGTFARFSITEGRAAPEGREWNLRPPGVGLRVGEPPNAGLMVFILVLLATVSWDGFTETEQSKRIALEAFYMIQDIGRLAVPIVELIGLAAFPVLFIAVYLVFMAAVSAMGGDVRDTFRVARIMVYSIVPIAIAYHLSHYYTLLAIDGQLLISRISDPFGFGWDLFGTAGHKVDIAVVSARSVWFISVGAIVVGHVAAVYLAHAEALKFYRDRRRALRSQLPMLVLMVGYTMISLWIIAQPIVA